MAIKCIYLEIDNIAIRLTEKNQNYEKSPQQKRILITIVMYIKYSDYHIFRLNILIYTLIK